jgi:hypothetical protein
MLVNVVDDDVKFPTIHVVASVLAWMSATINPFIYALKNRQYQQAFKEVGHHFLKILMKRMLCEMSFFSESVNNSDSISVVMC